MLGLKKLYKNRHCFVLSPPKMVSFESVFLFNYSWGPKEKTASPKHNYLFTANQFKDKG
jgi:hypothetical protein